MQRRFSTKTRPPPPACIQNVRLRTLASGAIATVAGLVLVRQRPKTAKGVTFLTLEDETGVANIIIWEKTFECFRRQVTSGRLLRVTGRIQNENGVVHLIARTIDDLSHLLDELMRLDCNHI
ncbi:MAG: OB-fold nucleic acid binding domain-containing protein [Rhodobacteraceae bacterium]|nr:OB-fold nucleic acid binding domain-containing protein [Paracoccaceae bacterium]